MSFLRKLQREINFFLTLDERVFLSKEEVKKQQPKQIPLRDYIAEVDNKAKNTLRR
ncbi:MAG TPA: hypothetical protein VE244_01525 [Nitrososphaeraceae archaeon]|nr:hypothetical protein [Thermoproteota archaeon]HZC47716.1 hypothetical protein [Nitrososphaeraceae archaeon]